MSVLPSTVWRDYLRFSINAYREFYICSIESCHKQCYIVQYEDLKKDFEFPLAGVVNFLTGRSIETGVLNCMHGNLEGIYHRPLTKDDHEAKESPYSPLVKDLLVKVQAEVNEAIHACVERGDCTSYGQH